MSSLAILILTKNEEDNIVDVVENAKKCTPEALVIDSGSPWGKSLLPCLER